MAPENLYDEILTKAFRGSLAQIATHHCGNFVVQALLSSAKSQVQVCILEVRIFCYPFAISCRVKWPTLNIINV